MLPRIDIHTSSFVGRWLTEWGPKLLHTSYYYNIYEIKNVGTVDKYLCNNL